MIFPCPRCGMLEDHYTLTCRQAHPQLHPIQHYCCPASCEGGLLFEIPQPRTHAARIAEPLLPPMRRPVHVASPGGAMMFLAARTGEQAIAQVDLAEIIEQQQSSVSLYMRGRAYPSLDMFLSLLHSLGFRMILAPFNEDDAAGVGAIVNVD